MNFANDVAVQPAPPSFDAASGKTWKKLKIFHAGPAQGGNTALR
jgi:hypothetical protein